MSVDATPAPKLSARRTAGDCEISPDALGVLLEYPPMYPIVKGRTDRVHGDRLLAKPAPRTRTYVTGDKPRRLSATAESNDCWNWKNDKSVDARVTGNRASDVGRAPAVACKSPMDANVKQNHREY